MYKQIKQLADEAIALQNKDRMDAALREISACCERAGTTNKEEVAYFHALAEKEMIASGYADITDKLAMAEPGDTVQIAGTENTETGNEKVLSVKVTPPAAKPAKKGAK